jgi:archaellum biogenesis ATPase FlaH
MTQFDLDDVVTSENPRVRELRAATRRANQPLVLPDQPYLVKSWLDAGGVSLLYGASNAGKTFFALDLAFHVAAGTTWQSNRVRAGRVLYLAAEGGAGFTRRLRALEIGLPALFADGQDSFTYLTMQIDLRSDEDARAIQAVVGNEPLDLVIVDTLAMAFGDGNENDAQDMTQFLKQVKTLGERLRCHVLLVHHPGKDPTRGARGSSTLRAAVETEIEITTDNSTGVRTATITKQREGATGLSVAFELESVTVGTDRDGEPITSCAVRQASSDALTRRKPLNGNNKLALEALQDALRLHGRRVTGSEELPSPREVVAIQLWREAFLERQVEKSYTPDGNRKAFKRALDWLESEDYICIQGDDVWLVEE